MICTLHCHKLNSYLIHSFFWSRSSKGMSKSDKIIVLERVIGSLGLQEIRNSLVGTVEKRGISGGQRKRVNVGIEMVMEPSLLILDEPTTGLDSASSQLLLRALRHEALQGVNVCAVIHQPRFPTFLTYIESLICLLSEESVLNSYLNNIQMRIWIMTVLRYRSNIFLQHYVLTSLISSPYTLPPIPEVT